MRPAAVALALLAGAAPGWAQTDFTNLTDAERAIFHAEIRAVLLAHPDVVSPPPAASDYDAAVADDLALIARYRDVLFSAQAPGFGPRDAATTLALLTSPDCAACAEAEADLRALAAERDIRVTLVDAAAQADLLQKLDLDLLPSYVFADKIVRGHVPKLVLQSYLPD